MKASFFLKFVMSALMMCVLTSGLAQTDSAGVDLTDLTLEQLLNVKIVTASKNLIEAGQAPATVLVISEEQIRVRGYRSLLDVIADLPDFKIDNNSFSENYNQVTVRGIQGQQKFVIMLDGMRISAPANESLPVFHNYPVNLAKQIEIIYGPASALYGADALSGIINIITKRSEFTPFKTDVFYSVGDNGYHNGTLFASKRLKKDAALTLSAQYFYDGGLDFKKMAAADTLLDFTSHQTGTFNTIFGPITPSQPVENKISAPLTAYNVYAGVKVDNFEFSFFRNYSQNSSAIANNPNNAVYNKDVFYGRGVNLLSSRYTKEFNKVTLTATIASSQYKVNPKSNYRNLYTGMDRAFKYGYSSMTRGEVQMDWRIGERSSIIGGGVYETFYSLPESADLQDPVEDNRSIEGVLINSKTYYQPEGIEAKMFSIRYDNVGGYLQLQKRIGGQLTSTLGARYDYNSRFGSTFNPRLGMVWNPVKKATVKAMFGTAYLAPTPGDAYSYYGSFYSLDSGRTYRSNFFHLPNPNLKPMKSSNFELSLATYLGKSLHATLVGYITNVDNLVGYAADEGNTNMYNGKFLGWDVDYIEVYVNQGHQRINGGSLRLEYNQSIKKGSIKTYAYLSYVDGVEKITRLDSNGAAQHYLAELEYISNWMLKSGVDLSLHNFSVSPRVIWMSHQHVAGFEDPDNPKRRQEIDGYTLLNVSLGYKFGKTTLHVNVLNALNQEYRSPGPNMDLQNSNTSLFYGNPQEARRFILGLRVAL